MPANKENNNPDNKPQKPVSNRAKSPPIVNVSVNTGIEQVNHINTERTDGNQQNDSVIVNVISPQQDNSAQIAANKIANRSFWVNTGLFVATLIVVGASIWQSKSAIRSAEIADSALREGRHYNDSIRVATVNINEKVDKSDAEKLKRDTDFINKQINFYTKSIANQGKSYQGFLDDNKKRYIRDTTALGIQIAFLKQSNDQFIKEHEPYLKVDIDSVYVKSGQLCFRYFIINLTNTPVRLTESKSGTFIANDKPAATPPQYVSFSGPLYVVKESPQMVNSTVRGFSDNFINEVLSGNKSVFWTGTFEYINEITEEKRVYSIDVKIQRVKGINPPFVHFYDNRNYPKKP